MPKNVKLAILRARHDVTIPTIGDRACIEMLMTSPTRQAVLDYWIDNTDQYLDFVGSELMPWVDIAITKEDIGGAGNISREAQARKAYEATTALSNRDLSGFDGFIVIIFPGQAVTLSNPQAGQVGQPPTVTVDFDRGSIPFHGKTVCVLPVMISDHSFMCHEVGHVLGFDDTYGVLNNEGRVYGDPYDIMSYATFGTLSPSPTNPGWISSPQFPGESVMGWPVGPKIIMGPAPALANVHQWNPSALSPKTVKHLRMPGGSQKHSVRLYSASAGEGSPRLVVAHPDKEDVQGRGICYVEYRDKRGWDAGLEVTGNDLARRAVVVHSLADTANDGVRCWFRGRILVPVEVDSDLVVTGTPLVVRVTEENVQDGHVTIEISTGKERGIDVHFKRRDEVVDSRDTYETKTPCGDTIIHGTWITKSTHSYYPVVYGLGGEGVPFEAPPVLTWLVGGMKVTGHSGVVAVTAPNGEFSLRYSLNPVTQELTLRSRDGERYSVDIVLTATEADGAMVTTHSTSFAPQGYYSGFRRGDLTRLNNCMERYLIEVKLRPRDLLIPSGPHPYREPWKDRVNAYRLREIIQSLQKTYPTQALALSKLAELRYGDLK